MEQKKMEKVEAKANRIFILRYNRPNMHRFMLIDATPAIPAANGQPAIPGNPGSRDVVLLPKNNFITEADWNLINRNPSDSLLLHLFEPVRYGDDVSSMMEFVDGFGPEDGKYSGSIDKILDEMPDKRATRVVLDTLNPEILSQWLDNEKRPTIKELICKQIESLKLPDRKTA